MSLIKHESNTEIILCMGSANERRCYVVTSFLIGWAHTQNDPWSIELTKGTPYLTLVGKLYRVSTPTVSTLGNVTLRHQKCTRLVIPLASTKLKGVCWLHFVCLSAYPGLFILEDVHLSVRVCKMVSALYLPQYQPDPFHIYNLINQLQKVCHAMIFWEIPKFEFLAISLNLSLWLCLVSM